nr:hypothetical protein [Candidatus Sigynarchaeota archaeon]
MVHVERTNGNDGVEQPRWPKLLMWAQICTICIYAFYIIIRWLHAFGAIDGVYWPLIHHFRNAILVVVGLYLGGVVLASKKTKKAEKQGESNRKFLKALVSIVVAFTIFVGILNVAKHNGLSPFVELGELSAYMKATAWISVTVEILVQVDAVAISMMLVLIVPFIVDRYQERSTIRRVYVFGHRVHESMIGMAWIVIGVMLILVSDYFDRIIGIFYLIFGAFLIGRDHHDVKDLSF